MSIITIFGSGKVTPDSKIYKNSEKAGKIIAKHGYDIATGGYYGIMEAAFKGASKFDVNRIAITIKVLNKEPNEFATTIFETDNYLDRLLKLMEIGDLYLLFPGASGTLLEFSYILAMKERKFIDKTLICYGKQWRKILKLIGYKKKEIKKLKQKNIFLVDNFKIFQNIIKKIN